MPAHDIIGTSACTAHQLTITKSEKTSSPGIVLENSMHTGPGGQTAVVVVEVDPNLVAGNLFANSADDVFHFVRQRATVGIA